MRSVEGHVLPTAHGRSILGAILLALVAASRPVLAADEVNGTVAMDGDRRELMLGLPRIAGPAIAGERLAGKVVVISFFASWCPPCLDEFAHLNELAHEFAAADVTLVAINVFEDWVGHDPSRLDRFIDHTKPHFSVLLGDDATRSAFGGIDRIPTVLVFGRQGRAVLRFVHLRGGTPANADVNELRTAIARAL